LDLDPWGASLTLLGLCHAFLAFAELALDHGAGSTRLHCLCLGFVGYVVLHLGDSRCVLINALNLVIKLFLFFKIPHFVTIGLILEVPCSIFLC
jgi:hypothetical protein